MEPIQQLQRWQEQLQTAPPGAVGDLLVCDRLIKHGMQTLERIAALERDLAEANSLAHSRAMTIERLQKDLAAAQAEVEKLRDTVRYLELFEGAAEAAALRADAEKWRALNAN